MMAATRHRYCQLTVRVTEQFVSLDYNKEKPTRIPPLLLPNIGTLDSAKDKVNDKIKNSFAITIQDRKGYKKFLEITNTWTDERNLTLTEEKRFSLIF